jgi:chemotaxis protein MotB
MAKGHFTVHKPEEKEDWLLSYADMITLLLAFFVLLLSMAKIDPVKFEKVQNAVAKNIGKHDTAQPIQQMKGDLEAVIKGMKLDDSAVSLGEADDGLMLEFDANTFFDPGSAAIAPALQPALVKLGATLDAQRYSAFQVQVQGHTDDQPSASPAYPSNWELSSARAAAVARLFIMNGMDPTRLSATGFADTRPKVPNHDMDGRPLAANEAINRRVDVHILPR